MGCCTGGGGHGASAEEKSRAKEIEKKLEKQKLVEENKVKLLLLGAGESGKSTLVKQFQILFNEGFDQKERQNYIANVYRNTVSNMKALINATIDFEIELTDDSNKASERVEELNPQNGHFDEQLKQDIATLWADPGIQEAFSRRNEFQLEDSAQYWFNNIERLCEPDYVPSTDDILRARVMTTGIVETKFTIEEMPFEVYDVGGQKNERRKWMHCFDGVTAVIFVVGLSEYDQAMREDTKTNRMHDALALWSKVCNEWMTKPALFLFLNKKDLFEEKIKEKDLSVCFPEYTGGSDLSAAMKFIEQKFKSAVKEGPGGKKRQVYFHFSTATDTDNVSFVFNGVKSVILEESLGQGLGFN